jgi:Domain of unknown function (DUF4190)
MKPLFLKLALMGIYMTELPIGKSWSVTQANRLTSDNPRSTVSDNFDNASPIDLSFGRTDGRVLFRLWKQGVSGRKVLRSLRKGGFSGLGACTRVWTTAKVTIFPAQTSGKAIASLVCGLFLFAFPLSILAVIFGHLSVSEIRKSSGRLKGEGIAIAGLVLGYWD